MEIHKVKPIHSWRDFLKELGTIVLGICIALGGEQALEWHHWNSQVEEARAVIASEMAYDLAGAIRRMRAVDCVENRLNVLSKILDDSARTGSLPPVGYIGQPPRNMWRSGAWDSVVASQTATHFPREQLAAIGGLYKIVQRAEEWAPRESEAWSDLYAMVGPGRRLDPASEADLRRALARARNAGRTLATMSMLLVNQAASLGLSFSPAELQALAAAKREPLTGQHPTTASVALMSMICEPIGAVPLNYNEAPTNMTPAVVGQAAKSLPDFGDAP